jgi:hypothetical protein
MNNKYSSKDEFQSYLHSTIVGSNYQATPSYVHELGDKPNFWWLVNQLVSVSKENVSSWVKSNPWFSCTQEPEPELSLRRLPMGPVSEDIETKKSSTHTAYTDAWSWLTGNVVDVNTKTTPHETTVVEGIKQHGITDYKRVKNRYDRQRIGKTDTGNYGVDDSDDINDDFDEEYINNLDEELQNTGYESDEKSVGDEMNTKKVAKKFNEYELVKKMKNLDTEYASWVKDNEANEEQGEMTDAMLHDALMKDLLEGVAIVVDQ